jgi:hypothetical protein
MNSFFSVILGVFGDRSTTLLALIVFVATAALAFGVMAAAHANSVKRRAAASPV